MKIKLRSFHKRLPEIKVKRTSLSEHIYLAKHYANYFTNPKMVSMICSSIQLDNLKWKTDLNFKSTSFKYEQIITKRFHFKPFEFTGLVGTLYLVFGLNYTPFSFFNKLKNEKGYNLPPEIIPNMLINNSIIIPFSDMVKYNETLLREQKNYQKNVNQILMILNSFSNSKNQLLGLTSKNLLDLNLLINKI